MTGTRCSVRIPHTTKSRGALSPNGRVRQNGSPARSRSPGRAGPSSARWREKPPADRDQPRQPERNRTSHDNPHPHLDAPRRALRPLRRRRRPRRRRERHRRLPRRSPIAFNFAMFWFSDRIALKMSRARPARAGRGARARRRRRGHLGARPDPRSPPVPDPVPAAERLRHGPEPAALRGRGHRGPVALMPREQVRGVLAHELAHIRNRDVLVTTIAAMIGAAISAIANFLQFQWLFGGDDDDSPLGAIGIDRRDPRRADRGDDAPVRDLPAARVPRRRDGRGAAGRGPPARGRARDARARGGGAADAGQPGHGVALHREPALRAAAWRRSSRRTRRSPCGSRVSRRSTPRAASS